MFSRIRETLFQWGYEEYNASPLERAELYEAKTSEEIVNEQTYTFMDRGDRRVTLRPEMTPDSCTHGRRQAPRAHLPAAVVLYRQSLPLRAYHRKVVCASSIRRILTSSVPLPSPKGCGTSTDIEIVRLASEILKAFGAKESDFVIRINSRTLLNAACKVGLKGDDVRQYLRLLDKKSKMTPEAFAAARETISTKDPLSLIEPKTMETFVATLKARGVGNVVFDPTITRGFDYYTGMVFEVFDTNPANPRALFGGGRYDGLVALFGGDSIPAVGFAIGEVPLGDFLETHSLSLGEGVKKPQLYLGTPSAGDIPAAQAFADTLRAQGARVFVNLTDRGLGDQIKDAVKRSIPYFVAYGTNEITEKTVRLKTLATGEEIVLPIPDLPERLRSET